MEQYLTNLSPSDISYISRQIAKLENDDNCSTSLIQDCLWRIASNAELISPEQLNTTEIFTIEQVELIWDFISHFKSFLAEETMSNRQFEKLLEMVISLANAEDSQKQFQEFSSYLSVSRNQIFRGTVNILPKFRQQERTYLENDEEVKLARKVIKIIEESRESNQVKDNQSGLEPLDYLELKLLGAIHLFAWELLDLKKQILGLQFIFLSFGLISYGFWHIPNEFWGEIEGMSIQVIFKVMIVIVGLDFSLFELRILWLVNRQILIYRKFRTILEVGLNLIEKEKKNKVNLLR